MEIREEAGFRVVIVDRAVLDETLLLAEATDWQVLTVTSLPGQQVKIALTR